MSRRSLAIALLAAVAAVGSVAVAQAPGAVKQQGATAESAARAAINRTWDDVMVAAKAGDAATLGALYTDDAIMIDPSMPTITGRANIEKMIRSWLATARLIDMTRTSSGIDVFGDIAIDNGTITQTVQEKGKAPMKVRSRYTMVFRNVNGRWLTLRDVTTPMPPARAR
ncbi:MAG: nuclear transport factor 2 family protein [bacterium]